MHPNPGKKIKMGIEQLLNPRPAVLVGTVVDDKPNFITVSWVGITSATPPTLSVAIRNIRYSLNGILQHKTFSVNIPPVKMAAETDYCGTVSGSEHDKARECGFRIFHGLLKNAPLIEQCPINMECQVIRNLKIGDHSLIIGEIIESYLSKDCFTDKIPDIKKIDPLCFCTLTPKSMGYYRVGEFVAKTGSINQKNSME